MDKLGIIYKLLALTEVEQLFEVHLNQLKMYIVASSTTINKI